MSDVRKTPPWVWLTMTVVNLGCVGLDLYAIASGGPSPLLWTALFVSWMAALCCALAWYGARWPLR